MYLERKQELSIYYWLKDDVLASVSNIVNIVDGYPDSDVNLPTVAVVPEAIRHERFELGSRNRLRYRSWAIDVYAVNKAQVQEIVSIILNSIEDGIPVYNYDEGFPPGANPSKIGHLVLDELEVVPVRVFPELIEKLYWRNSIRFTTYYEEA